MPTTNEMSSRYPQITDKGVSIRSKRLVMLACCDCGLIHRVIMVSHDGKSIGLAMKRDNRATAARRRSKTVMSRINALLAERKDAK